MEKTGELDLIRVVSVMKQEEQVSQGACIKVAAVLSVGIQAGLLRVGSGTMKSQWDQQIEDLSRMEGFQVGFVEERRPIVCLFRSV